MKKVLLVILLLISIFALSCNEENKGAKEEYVTITFDTSLGTPISDEKVVKETKANRPNDPIRGGYGFQGWYLNDELFDFDNTTCNDNITLVAKWVPLFTYSVTREDDKEWLVITGGIKENIGKTLTIPKEIDGQSVYSISTYAFKGYEIETLEIEEGVQYVDDSAFCECRKLKEINLPSSVWYYGNHSFAWCDNLKSITIPDSSRTINVQATMLYKTPIEVAKMPAEACVALTNHSSLVKVEVTSGFRLYESSFSGCVKLSTITLPNTLRYIEKHVFVNCKNLEKIIIPKKVREVGVLAFNECPKLTIFCEAESKPSDWSSAWNANDNGTFIPVVWNYTE